MWGINIENSFPIPFEIRDSPNWQPKNPRITRLSRTTSYCVLEQFGNKIWDRIILMNNSLKRQKVTYPLLSGEDIVT